MNDELLLKLLQDDGYIGNYLNQLHTQAGNKMASLPLDPSQWGADENNPYLNRYNAGAKNALIAFSLDVLGKAREKGMRPYAYRSNKVKPGPVTLSGAKEDIKGLLGQINEAKEYLENRGYVINAKGEVEKAHDIKPDQNHAYNDAIRELTWLDGNYDRTQQVAYLKATPVKLPEFTISGKPARQISIADVENESRPAALMAVEAVDRYRYSTMRDKEAFENKKTAEPNTLKAYWNRFTKDVPDEQESLWDMGKALITGENLAVSRAKNKLADLPSRANNAITQFEEQISGQILKSQTPKTTSDGAGYVPASITDPVSGITAPVFPGSRMPATPPAPATGAGAVAVPPVTAGGNGGAPAAAQSQAAAAPTATATPATDARKQEVADRAQAAFNGQTAPTAPTETAQFVGPPLPTGDQLPVTPASAANTEAPAAAPAPVNDPNDILAQDRLANEMLDRYRKGQITRGIGAGMNVVADTVNAINAGSRLDDPMPEYQISPQLMEAYKMAKRLTEEGMPDISTEIMRAELRRTLAADQVYVTNVAGGSGGAALGARMAGLRTHYEANAKVAALDEQAKREAMPGYINVAGKVEDQYRKAFEDKLAMEKQIRESAANLVSESMTRINNSNQFMSSYGPGSINDIYQWSTLMRTQRNDAMVGAGNAAYLKEQEESLRKKDGQQRYDPNFSTTGTPSTEYGTPNAGNYILAPNN
jgi:hypothetical protein